MEQSEESCKKESKAARKALKKAKKKSKEKTKGLAADSGITEEQMTRNEERLHTTLDVAGMIDPTGVADGFNALLYTGKGDFGNAMICVAGIVPYAGDAAKSGRLGVKAAKAADVGEAALKNGSKMKVDDVLDYASSYLGKGYKESVKGSGRYVSKDGTRVFRMGNNDILGKHGGGPHVNFEKLQPNPSNPEKMQVVENIHIFLEE